MPYYSNTPLQQNYNTSTQQNRITPMLQYVNITLHQSPDSIGISDPIYLSMSAKSRTFVSARPPIGKRLATPTARRVYANRNSKLCFCGHKTL